MADAVQALNAKHTVQLYMPETIILVQVTPPIPNPKPYSLNPEPFPTPYTLHPKHTPHTLHPTSYTLHPTPDARHPKPSTLNLKH